MANNFIVDEVLGEWVYALTWLHVIVNEDEECCSYSELVIVEVVVVRKWPLVAGVSESCVYEVQ